MSTDSYLPPQGERGCLCQTAPPVSRVAAYELTMSTTHNRSALLARVVRASSDAAPVWCRLLTNEPDTRQRARGCANAPPERGASWRAAARAPRAPRAWRLSRAGGRRVLAGVQRPPQPACAAVRRAHACPNALPALCSMACSETAEAQQLSAVAAALQQRDVASIARLTSAASSTVVCQAGCGALVDVLNADCQLTMEELQHAVEALVSALRAQPTCAGVQQTGCHGLAIWCEAFSDACNVAAAHGAVDAVIAALRAHVQNGDVIGAACFALASLLDRSPENCCFAHGAGALDALMKCEPVHTAEAAWRQGAFQVLVDILALHKMQPVVVDNCCFVATELLVLCARSTGTAFKPTDAEAEAAMRVTIAAMEAHPAHHDFQGRGCKLLSELAFNAPQLAVVAAEAGVMEAVVHVVRAFTNSHVGISRNACIALGKLASVASVLRHRALAAGAVAAVVTLMKTRPLPAQAEAANTLNWLCTQAPDACAHAIRCGVVIPLCDAIRTHAGVPSLLRHALETLKMLINIDPSVAAEVAANGPSLTGVVVRLLLSSSTLDNMPEPGDMVLTSLVSTACEVLAAIAACGPAASSPDAVLPLLHVLQNACALENLVLWDEELSSRPRDEGRNNLIKHRMLAITACRSLLLIAHSSPAHAAEADKCGASAAVDAAARAQPLELQDAELQTLATQFCTLLARNEAERRAAAMADELIAEEEAARAARTAPQASARKRPKKKRGGGGGNAADSEGAAAANDAALLPEPEFAVAAALSALALDEATPSAAAMRRRRRAGAATKAARRLAQRAGAAGSSEPAAAGDTDETEDNAQEGDAADAAVSAAPSTAAPPQPPRLMKECCVCMLDMPAVEQVVLTPCGHRCMCEACWREQLLPREPAARLCPICDARVEWVGRMTGLFDA